MGEHADANMLSIAAAEIRRHGPGNLLGVVWRQRRTERRLARRGIRFRSDDLATVAAAYAAMTAEEFDAINGIQDWANWRTIPRALNGHVADRPLVVLDLGCGTGGSTRALAFYCPLGSRIIGYELAQPLVDIARRRNYRHRSGSTLDVSFCCQGVTETLRQVGGQPFPDETIDLVNASGVVGHHLNAESIQPLIRELRRILVPGGVAMLDVGPTLNARTLAELMTADGFEKLGHYRSWPFDPTGEVVFRKCVTEPDA